MSSHRMLHNTLTHITTHNSLSFPAVRWRHAERPQPPCTRGHQLSRRPTTAMRSSTTLAVDTKTGGGKGMRWFYEMEEEVRDYELDQFGVVNNAVYNNYYEHATSKLLEKIGFDAADISWAASEASFKYIAPLKRKDKFLVKLKIVDFSTTRLYFELRIVKLPNHELIFRGTATLVILDKKLRPSRITPSMMSKFNNFLLAENHN